MQQNSFQPDRQRRPRDDQHIFRRRTLGTRAAQTRATTTSMSRSAACTKSSLMFASSEMFIGAWTICLPASMGRPGVLVCGRVARPISRNPIRSAAMKTLINHARNARDWVEPRILDPPDAQPGDASGTTAFLITSSSQDNFTCASAKAWNSLRQSRLLC